ncbi:MAG: lipoate--protein ligase family protein [Verrucomicrobia bacterium]|nr:lipoate--protein ligase family protein [Verrucomicrobiota bacterium]
MPMAFHFLHLQQFPILEQLKIEEALLRSDERNWCIINEGSPVSIVMGISGKKEELIDLEKARQDNIPVIKRFSGGGTVIVDEDTLFVTFICDKKLHAFPAFPEPIMKWTEGIYKDVFVHEQFRLRENDFVIGEKKMGGNAQYIKKDRWLHHTSFLWDYSDERMQYLLHPKKTPHYREGRSHSDFLCRLSDHFPEKPGIVEQIQKALQKNFEVHISSLDEARALQTGDARQSTALIET